jgi:hypothetical protein
MFLLWRNSPHWGQVLIIIEVSWSHWDTPHSLGLLWTSDQPVAGTFTSQHTKIARDGYPFRRRDSNPQFQEASGRRPTPLTALPLGPAVHINRTHKYCKRILHTKQMNSRHEYRTWTVSLPKAPSVYCFTLCSVNYHRQSRRFF